MKKKNRRYRKTALSLSMTVMLLLGVFTAVDSYYNADAVSAASFSVSSGSASAPAYNSANFPSLDTTGTGSSTTSPSRQYYYGQYGNAFYGVTDNSSSGYWELVDTDAKINGVSLKSTWNSSNAKGCTILSYTNGLTDTCFSTADKKGMKTSDISTDVYQYSSYLISSTYYSTVTESDAYLWPLSVTQLNTSGSSVSTTLNGLAAALYSNAGANVWSRSFAGCYSSNSYYYAWRINSSYVYGNYSVTSSYAVAPAFNLDLTKVLIARSATSATSSTSLASAAANAVAGSASGDLKFLVNAGSTKASPAFTSSSKNLSGAKISNAVAGKSYTISYSSASTSTLNGGTNYISAILYDSNGKVAYYGNLGTVSSASGSVTFTVPSGISGTYTLALFEEEKCAAYKTDYASTPVYTTMVVSASDYETSGSISGSVYDSTKGASVSSGGNVNAGDVLTTSGLTGTFTYLSLSEASTTVYLTTSTPSSTKVSTTSVTVPSDSTTFTVYAVIYPSSSAGVTAGYVSKTFTFNVNYESETVFSLSGDYSSRTSFNVNDEFTNTQFNGTITWLDNTTSAVDSSDLYIVPASVWESWSDDERTKTNVTALSETDYYGGTSITVSSELLGADETYSLYTVYFPTHSGAAAYHATKWTFTSNDLYAVSISAECSLNEAEYGDLITDSDIVTTVKMSGTDNYVNATAFYVMPTETWKELSVSKVSDVTSVAGVNSVVIPSESDLNGAESYGLTVIYFDYSSQHTAGENGIDLAGDDCTMFTTAITLPLASSVTSDYQSYTYLGVTWYYLVETDDEGNETGYATNVYTTNEDIRQYINTDGALEVPETVGGYTVKSIGSGTKAYPFVPSGVNSFTSILFPDTLTTINAYAFYANTSFLRLEIPESVNTVGIFAFYDCDNITSVTIHSTSVGTGAFGNNDSLAELTIDGTGSIGKVAFAECVSLTKVTIKGTNDVGKSAFVDDSQINALNLSELTNSTINAYAFKNCTGISSLNVPNTNEVKAYAFDGCYGITNLELDIATVENYSFQGCCNIQYLIFASNVSVVEYDWGGYSADVYDDNSSYDGVIKTTVYIKNQETLFQTYRNGTEFYSSLMGRYNNDGANKYSRNISVYITSDGTAASTHNISFASNTEVMVSATMLYYSTAVDDYVTDGSGTDTYTYMEYLSANGLHSVSITSDADTSDASVSLETTRDGITAYYDGKIYDNAKADKDSIVVTPTYSDAATATSNITDFYFYDAEEVDEAIRAWIVTTDYAYKDVVGANATEDAKAYSNYKNAYDMGYMTADELETETKAMVAAIINTKEDFLAATEQVIDNPTINTVTSTLGYDIQTMYVIYYPDETDEDYNEGETGEVSYYLTSFDVKVMEYTAESAFFDDGYTYESVMEAITELEESVTELSTQVESLTESYENALISATEYEAAYRELSQTHTEYVNMYNELLEALEEYISGTDVSDDGYFGTVTDANGTVRDVIWIDGVECSYTETGEQESGYDTYTGYGDIDSDGEADEFTFYVADDGVHVITVNGEELEEEEVYSDKIKNLQAKLMSMISTLTEQLAEVTSELEEINDALSELYELLDGEDADDLSASEKMEYITEAVTDLLSDYDSISDGYQELSESYQQILDYIYGEGVTAGDVTADDVIDKLEEEKQSEIDEAVEEALSNAESLNSDAESVQNAIAGLISEIMDGDTISTDGMTEDLATALNDVQSMKASVDSMQTAIDGYTSVLLTIQTALGLDDTATTAEILAAITGLKDQVEELTEQVAELQVENLSLQAKITELQSSDTGTAYNEGYEDGYTAGVAASGTTSSGSSGSSYSEGYSAGYTAGAASVDTSASSTTYTSGYNAGYAAGAASVDTSTNSTTYTSGYNAGYAAGAASVDTSASSTTYTSGYNAGYAAGAASVDTSTNSTTYTSGYNAGYAAGLTAGIAENGDATESVITTLSEQVTSLSEANTALTDSNEELEEKVDDLEDEVSTLTSANKALTAKVNTLNETVTTQAEELKASSSSTSTATKSSTSSTASVSPATTTASSAVTSASTGTSSASAAKTTAEDESNDESSTESTKNSSLVVPQSTDGQNVVEIVLPDSSEIYSVDTTQTAVTSLMELSGNNPEVETNAKSLADATAEQKSMASLILTYYMNHLSELGELGSDEITEAATNEYASVSFEVIAAFDVEQSKKQKNEIEESGTATLTLSSEAFEDGGLYLVIHESELRENTFDVLLTEVSDGSIAMDLPDFSPVTIAKISITENTVVTEPDTELMLVEAEETETAETKSNGGFRIVMYILIIVAVLVLGILIYLMKNPQAVEKIKNIRKRKK